MSRRFAAAAAAAALTIAVLAGCQSAPGGLLDGSPGENDYVSTDGSTTTIALANRGEPVDFAGTTDAGESVDSAELRGEVVVLNFWYADCPPCRLEAADLEELHQQFTGEAVFLGVNVRDTADRARSFADEFEVSYPSILDAGDNGVQLAFVGKMSPNAVPTTLVLDREGRVAARISGLVSDPALLARFVDDVLAEAA